MAEPSEEQRAITNRLDQLAVTLSPGKDPVLGMFDTLGRGGVGVAVVMIVDGVRIQGVLGPPRRFADAAADAAAGALEGSSWSDEAKAEIVGPMRAVEDVIAAQVAEQRRVVEDVGVDVPVDDIPPSEATTYFRAFTPRSTIDVFDATVHLDGAVHSVGAMRISRRSIGAWWPLAEEPGAEIRYNWRSDEA